MLLSPINLLRQSVRLLDPSESLEILEAAIKLNMPGTQSIPRDLLKLGIKMHLRGFLNTVSVQGNLDWIWPYWIERQFNPRDHSYIPRGHGLPQINLTHRNWTIIGSAEHSFRGIVDPRSLITPWKNGWSLDYWLDLNGRLFVPARSLSVKQSIHPQFPQVKTQFEVEKIALKARVFAAKVLEKPFLILHISLVNRGKQALPLKFYFSLRPYNPEGISFIRQLEFVEDRLWLVNDRPGLFLPESPDRVSCSNHDQGDVSFLRNSQECRNHVSCELGMATGLAEYSLSLKPQGKKEYLALLTMDSELPRQSPSTVINGFNYQGIRQESRRNWQERLAGSTEVNFPDKRLTRSFQANRIHLQMFDRGQMMTPGALTYDSCWIRDSAFMVHALDKLGFHRQAREKLLYFLTRQSKDGFFNFQEGEWDANGLALWTMVEHFRLTRDRAVLDHLYPSMYRAAQWIERTRHKSTKSTNGPPGLLPRGYSAEHLGNSDIYYWDNFWCLAGLKSAAYAARILGRGDEARSLKRFAAGYWRDIEKSLEQSNSGSKIPFLPAAPGRRMDSGAIGSLCSVYPLRLINAQDPRVQNTVALLEERYLMGQGVIQHHFHSGLNCYLSAHLAQCYLASGNPKTWNVVRYLLKRATPTFTWPEAIHPITGGGCMGEGHHGWAAAEWILLLLNLLSWENKGSLWITPLLQQNQLAAGNIFSVCNAPSIFGRISFILSVDKKEIWLELSNDFHRSAPDSILWSLPFKPSRIFLDGACIPESLTPLKISPQTSSVILVR